MHKQLEEPANSNSSMILATFVAGSKKEKYKWTQQLSLEDVDYLESLPLSITLDGLSCSIVHAGVGEEPRGAKRRATNALPQPVIRLRQ